MYSFKDTDVLRDGYEHFTNTGFNDAEAKRTVAGTGSASSLLPMARSSLLLTTAENAQPVAATPQIAEPENAGLDERFSLGRGFNQKGVKRENRKFEHRKLPTGG